MKVAFVNSSFQEGIPKNIRNIMMAEAMYINNVESIFYTPIRKKSVVLIRREGKHKIVSIIISCWVPFFSRYKNILKNFTFLRRIVDLMEYFIYIMRIRRRLRYDRIDAYIFLHLWSSTLPLLSFLLSRLRPVAILWMGHSLRWLARFKWQYPLILTTYKFFLYKSNILINDDFEQKYYIYNVLKKTQKKVFIFNPCIVNEKIFYSMDKYKCAKKVGFNTTNINIVAMVKIRNSKFFIKNKNWDYSKNIILGIEIFSWLVKENSNVHLHIVGDGPGMKELKLKIDQYSLQDKVTLHGWIPPTNNKNDLRPFFINAADLIMNPQPLLEFNDATAIFEAFICGKPVVAYKRYPWVPIEHKGGFLIDMDPRVGANQIASRLNTVYLENKSKEAKHIPYENNVPLSVWGKKLSEILKEILREWT